MKKLIEKFLIIFIGRLGLNENNIVLSPKQWIGFVAEMAVIFTIINAILYGFLYFIGSLILALFILEGSAISITVILFGIAGIFYGIFFKKVHNDGANFDIPVGHRGIIMMFGEIYGRKEGYRTTMGFFKKTLSLPFFGEIFSIVPQRFNFDNIDKKFDNPLTADGQIIIGEVSVEIEMYDIYTAYELEQSTEKGIVGKVDDIVIRIINRTFINLDVEDVVLSGKKDDGVGLVYSKFMEQVEELKTTPEKRSHFEEKIEPTISSEFSHADVSFPEVGVNLKFLLKKNIPKDEDLLKEYTGINIAQAGKKRAEAEQIVRLINANTKAEEIKREGAANIAVRALDFEMIREKFIKFVAEDVMKEGVTRASAEHNARLLLDMYNDEKLVELTGPGGIPLQSAVSQIGGILMAALEKKGII